MRYAVEEAGLSGQVWVEEDGSFSFTLVVPNALTPEDRVLWVTEEDGSQTPWEF